MAAIHQVQLSRPQVELNSGSCESCSLASVPVEASQQFLGCQQHSAGRVPEILAVEVQHKELQSRWNDKGILMEKSPGRSNWNRVFCCKIIAERIV
ncbi:unnamed protein product [Gadus morhua 'NCC']